MWIEKARLGEPNAWEQIVRHFGGMAFSVAYAKLGDRPLAEDAVQEAFAAAYADLGKLQQAEAFPGWFKTIVERQCHRLLRRKKHATIALHDANITETEPYDVERIAERREWYRKLHQSVEGLSGPLKQAVHLYYFQGYSIKEVSGFLNVPPSALKKRLFDARTKLRSALFVTDSVSMFNDIGEGGASMLHIVNGDHVGDKLRKGNIRGDILVWREVYPVGPVFLERDEPETFRKDYLARTFGIPAEEYEAACKSQEQALHHFHKYEEVVLWFEHDLFDQLMLSRLLHWFSAQRLGDTKLSLLCVGSYPGIELFKGLGQLTPKQLAGLSGTWRQIGPKELETGKSIWEAYASPDIARHVEITQEDTSALPYAHAALEAHLARLPSAMNGLGIVEQTTLELVRHGVNTPRALFAEIGNRISLLGMGDLEYWYRLRCMLEQPHALLEMQGSFSLPGDPDRCVVALTELGREAAAGATDWVTVKGIDEWYGGLRLHGNPTWRWDAASKRLVYRE